MECGRQQSMIEQIESAFSSHSLFTDGMDKYSDMDYSGAISEFEACLKLRQNFMYKYDESLTQVQDKLAECLSLIGDYEKSAKYSGKPIGN